MKDRDMQAFQATHTHIPPAEDIPIVQVNHVLFCSDAPVYARAQ